MNLKWNKCDEFPPPHRTILVWGVCGMPHVAIWDYNVFCHTEHCYENGSHFTGGDIRFTHWAELPNPPEPEGKNE